MTSPFKFHYEKAAHAAAAFLRQSPNYRMNYYRLLKLLYIADRESLRETGRPIVGGRLIAMCRGPLHSAYLDLVKGNDPESPWWMTHFRTDKFDVEMRDDPGNTELSKRELDLINRVSQEHEEQDEWAVGAVTHEFPEFKSKPPAEGEVRTIPFQDVVEAVGRGADLKQIEDDAKNVAEFEKSFGC